MGLQYTSPMGFMQVYRDLLSLIMSVGSVDTNKRTGVKIKAIHGVSFAVDLRGGLLPVAGNRRLFPATAAAEMAWYILGTQDAEFILRHARVTWEKFVEEVYFDRELYGDDWKTPAHRYGVKAAYGYRWRRHFLRDQLALGIEALRKDPSDRRVWISAWDPASDGLGEKGQLNVPCPVGFSLSVDAGHVNSSYMLRSSDVFVGLPYDVMGHAILMAAIAASLGLRPGVMHFTLAHPHVYEKHWEMALNSLAEEPKFSSLSLPMDWTVERVENEPDAFVSMFKALSSEVSWPSYHCRPEVVQ